MTDHELARALIGRAGFHPRAEELRYYADELRRFADGNESKPQLVRICRLRVTRAKALALWNATDSR